MLYRTQISVAYTVPCQCIIFAPRVRLGALGGVATPCGMRMRHAHGRGRRSRLARLSGTGVPRARADAVDVGR